MESDAHIDGTQMPLADDPFWGVMNYPTSSAAVIGLCGDSMEFYLDIRDGLIEDVKYCANGCEDTIRCGRAVAAKATGQTVMDALAISPRQIIGSLEHLPGRGRHCAILAVTTLYRAIADYLLKP